MFVLHVPTTYAQTTTASLLAQVRALQTALQALEQQLLRRNTIIPTDTRTPLYNYNNTNINRIEVNFVGDIAQIRVLFNNTDARLYAFQATNTSEVAQLLAPELNLPPTTILGLITQIHNTARYRYNDFNYNTTSRYDNRTYNDRYTRNTTSDIRDIIVDFSGNDANIFVRFRGGSTDRFTLNSVYRDENDTIRRLADRYNMSRRDIDDVIYFN
jgi:hypothetical protein